MRDDSQLLSEVFQEHESNVRSYCRAFPAVFSTAKGARITDISGNSYLDLLSGAGSLNYGHNNPAILGPVIAYLSQSGVVHSLDLHTAAKAEFIQAFEENILAPRLLRYKLQFPGPTGTNAIEAALKLARKVTGRTQVVSFSNGFHGMTIGALAATSNPAKRAGAGLRLDGVTFMPYDGFIPNSTDTMPVIEAMVSGRGSGLDKPAAFLIETVQGEGGLNAARAEWLRRLSSLAKSIGALLIIDDIQAGCGRTGKFFSFETSALRPDIVVLSKSLSGFGSPMSLVLISPELDQWAPGEHNGTFRGNNLAFVGATAAINAYWRDGVFENEVEAKATRATVGLQRIVDQLPRGSARVKGRGLLVGIEFNDHTIATNASRLLFEKNVIIETCGHYDQVLKFLPPLTISVEELDEAIRLIGGVVESLMENDSARVRTNGVAHG